MTALTGKMNLWGTVSDTDLETSSRMSGTNTGLESGLPLGAAEMPSRASGTHVGLNSGAPSWAALAC